MHLFILEMDSLDVLHDRPRNQGVLLAHKRRWELTWHGMISMVAYAELIGFEYYSCLQPLCVAKVGRELG